MSALGSATALRQIGWVALFAGYVCASCFGLYLIKASPNWKSVQFVIGFALYAGAAALWMVILRLSPLSLAFPIAAGSLIIGSLVTGYFFLGEAVTTARLVGAALIIAGIGVIAVRG